MAVEERISTKWSKVFAGVVGAIGIALIVYALLAPQQTTSDQTDHMGMYGPHSTYSSERVVLVAVGIIAVVAGLMIVLLRDEYVPLPASMMSPPPIASDPAPPLSHQHEMEDRISKEYLALRLLTGDERTMFKAIMDSGGEALQKDLIAHTRMSNAKVSRILERLCAKGVVTKNRQGSTNMIRIRMDS